MTTNDGRTMFKYRTHMTDIKFNYKNKEDYVMELWKCDSCQTAIELQSHILWCPAYQELRGGKDIKGLP